MPLKEKNHRKAVDPVCEALGIEEGAKGRKEVEDALKTYSENDDDDAFYTECVNACKKAKVNGMNSAKVEKALKKARLLK